MQAFFRSRFAPFRHSNFRKFFFVQTVSMVGTWAHDLARSWIILNMLGNASALGAMLLATALPGLALALHGGVLADRKDVRRIMTATKSILACSALLLAFFVEFEHIQMWHLLLYGLVEGAIVAFDAPTFQALTVRLVPREEIQQAIALNSTNFHAARMLGPIIGGALLAIHGPSLVFLFDAISYVALVLVLKRISLRPITRLAPQEKTPPLKAMTEGVRYVLSEPRLRYMLAQLTLSICIASPIFAVIFRSYLTQKFALTSRQFGTVFMFPAVGSVLGAVCFAIFKPKQPLRALQIGAPLAVLGIVTVALAESLPLAGAAMSVGGFGLYLSLAALTVSVQLTVREEYTGRVSSIIGLGFNSLGPLMAMPIGLFSDLVGARVAIVTLASSFALGSTALAWRYRKVEVSRRAISASAACCAGGESSGIGQVASARAEDI